MDKDEKKGKSTEDKEKKSLDDMLIEAEKEIDKILKEAGALEEDGKKVKVIRIGKPRLPRRLNIIRYALLLITDFVLMAAISGYINWFSFSSNLLIGLGLFSIAFTVLDSTLKIFTAKLYPSIIFYSFGSINFLISLVSIWLGVVITPDFAITNQSSLTIFLIMFLITRFIVGDLVFRFLLNRVIVSKRRK